MKKLLVLLLAVLALGGLLAAQDQAMPKPIGTFGSWNTGSLSVYESIDGGAASTAWNNAWGTPGGIDQEWGFGYNGNNLGFTSRFVFESDTIQGPGLSSFDVYYNLNKYVQVAIGKPRGGEYRGFGTLADGFNNGNFFANSQPGVELNLTPIDSLALSAFFTAPFGNNAVKVTYSDNIAFGGQYTMSGLFSVRAMYQAKNVAATTGVDSYFHASVQVTPVKDLTITADASIPQGTGQNSTFSGSAGYALMGGALIVQGDFGYQTNTSSIGVEANVGYNVSTYTVGARVGYQDGKGVGMFGSAMSDINTVGGGNGVLVYPYVKANFDAGFVQLGVAYQSGAGTPSLSKLDIPLYYGWSF